MTTLIDLEALAIELNQLPEMHHRAGDKYATAHPDGHGRMVFEVPDDPVISRAIVALAKAAPGLMRLARVGSAYLEHEAAARSLVAEDTEAASDKACLAYKALRDAYHAALGEQLVPQTPLTAR